MDTIAWADGGARTSKTRGLQHTHTHTHKRTTVAASLGRGRGYSKQDDTARINDNLEQRGEKR